MQNMDLFENDKKYIYKENTIKGVSLFSNVGISETYFLNNNIEIVCANELIEKRVEFYKHLYPNTKMICGYITDDKIFSQIIEEYKKNNCEFLIATPPCQGMSIAGKMDKNDIRNKLIYYVVEFIKKTEPKNIIIENVPQILNFSIKINEKEIKIIDYIKNELSKLNYFINYDVLDACYYNTPQYRKRAIFLISKYKKWEFPEKNKQINVEDVISDLPSLESRGKINAKFLFFYHYNNKKYLYGKY